MKTLKFFLLAGGLLAAASAQPRGSTAPSEPPPVTPPALPTIHVPTVAAELAAGYAIAIPQMTTKSVVIYLKSDGKTVAIRGIRSAKAMGAVLLIEFSAGDRMAVNAENIVMITDGLRTP